MVFGRFFLVIFGSLWVMVVLNGLGCFFGGSGWFLVVLGGLCGFWWFLAVLGYNWWYLVVLSSS